MEPNRLQADLDAFDISEKLGFAFEAPLTNLPDHYRAWMELANDLPNLIESRKLRDLVHKMPVLSTHLLNSPQELRLAHLALGFITMGYVWQEGQHAPAKILPRALAVPYWVVSRRLGLPAVLTYADSVLSNWKLRDPSKGIEIGNMDLVISLPGGGSCRGFFLVSLLVEMAASSGIKGTLEVMHAVENKDPASVNRGLLDLTASLKKMKEIFKLMHQHVVPAEFYGTLRIFVSGWRDNPMLPEGLVYEGVSNEPVLLSGGSAAQSTAIQCFDALLGIQHDNESGAFLTRMRDYMPPAHRQLIETLSDCPSLRDFILSCANPDLKQAFNDCVLALEDLRTYHVSAVTKYIVVPANRAQETGHSDRGAGDKLDATGTGGSSLLVFLKSVRDTTRKVLI
ncbi:indoleamine 2,3-dioxygenase 2-like [Myripristis murdjan]|uniref:indoleamine 2,3-dioxygenase 2-like n=1 Tax=Myripristis murdjan TaxID=586833 RepID=UPI0011760A51|nr:indoleamine 2,3-dioxygenase 2-like [Myripristis murdjan]